MRRIGEKNRIVEYIRDKGETSGNIRDGIEPILLIGKDGTTLYLNLEPSAMIGFPLRPAAR